MEKKTKNEKSIKSPIQPRNPLLTEKEVDYKTRTILLLDARNDLITLFFGGLDAMSLHYKNEKAENPFIDMVYMTCKGFVEKVKELSQNSMAKKNPQFGIGDMLKNKKGQVRFIINLWIEPKTNELMYTWVDPHDAKSPPSVCSQKTMVNWSEQLR